MKKLYALLLLAPFALAASQAKTDTTVTVTAEKVLGVYNWDKDELEVKDDAEPKDVVRQLVSEIGELQQRLVACEAKLAPKKKKPAKAKK